MSKKTDKLKIKCHGHQCPDKDKCPLYSIKRTDGDEEKGNNSIDCEMIEYYDIKI